MYLSKANWLRPCSFTRMTRLASLVSRGTSPGQRSAGSRAIPMSDLLPPLSRLRQVDLVGGRDAGPRRHLHALAAQALLQGREQLKDDHRSAIETHDPD